MERQNWIDRLKGVAIILVVMGHLYCKCLHTTNSENDVFFSVIQAFHMPLFMFLSGVVISTIPSLRKMLRKSIQLMIPAILVGSVLTLFTGREIVGMFMSSSKYGYWYLYVLALFYWILLFFKLLPQGKWTGLGGAFLMSALIWLGLKGVENLLPKELSDALSIPFASTNWLYFAFGVIFTKYNMKQISAKI